MVEGERPTAGVELPLQVEDARDALVRSREVSRRELLRAILSSGAAGGAFGLEAWGAWRGEPVFGWLVFVLFAGFATYFWSRRSKADDAVACDERILRQLEVRRSVLTERDDRPVVPPLMPDA